MRGLFPRVDYAVQRRTHAHWRIPERTIDNHELVLITSGRGCITLNQCRCDVGEGDLIYFTPGLRHSLWVDQPPYMEFLAVHFTLEPGGPDRLPLPPLSHPCALSPLREHLRDVARAYASKPAYYEWTQELALSQALHALIAGAAAPRQPHRISRALDYIHTHPAERISLAQLCALSGLGKSQFTAEFRRLTGASPIDYCLKLRLERARDLLLSSSAPVRDIAAECGFDDPLYFSRRFAARYGASPQTYRARSALPED